MNTATIQTETTEIYVGDGVYIDLPTLPYIKQVNDLNKYNTKRPQDYMWEEYKPHFYKFRNDAHNDVINMNCKEFLNKYKRLQFVDIHNELEDERIGSSNRKLCKGFIDTIEQHHYLLTESNRVFENFTLLYNRFINNVVRYDPEDTNNFSESSKLNGIVEDIHDNLITEHSELVYEMHQNLLKHDNIITITTREVEIYIGEGVYIDHICLPDEIQFAIKNRLDMVVKYNQSLYARTVLNCMEKINAMEWNKHNTSILALAIHRNYIDWSSQPRTVKELRDIAKSNRIKLPKCTTKQQILTHIYNSWKNGAKVVIKITEDNKME